MKKVEIEELGKWSVDRADMVSFDGKREECLLQLEGVGLYPRPRGYVLLSGSTDAQGIDTVWERELKEEELHSDVAVGVGLISREESDAWNQALVIREKAESGEKEIRRVLHRLPLEKQRLIEKVLGGEIREPGAEIRFGEEVRVVRKEEGQ